MSIGLVQRKTGNPLTVPMTGPLAARLASWLLDERPATDDDRVFVRYKAPHVALGVIHRCTRRSAVSCGTPGSDAGRFQAVAAQRGDEDAGGGHAVADDQRGAWPRRPRFHTRLHGHAPRGNARVRAARAGRRIVMNPRNTDSSARSPANWRSTSASRRPWAGMAPPASGSCARSTGIASNTGPCVWSGASWSDGSPIGSTRIPGLPLVVLVHQGLRQVDATGPRSRRVRAPTSGRPDPRVRRRTC